MGKLLVIIFSLAAASVCIAQSDLEKMVDTEKAFAAMALESGTKAAFLANMTEDAVVYTPDRNPAKPFWNQSSDSPSRLVWAPNYADMSANGIIGYTTGNWEFRTKGISDSPSRFGTFITVWLRQASGVYKWVVDIGVTHDRPATFATDWTTSQIRSRDLNEKNISAADLANGFFSLAAQKGLAKAYSEYLTDDARGFREGRQPFLGKKALVALAKEDKAVYNLSKRSTFFGSADIAYSMNTYTKALAGKVVEKGNTLHIWKLVNGRWRIVLDVFKAVP